jgi:hypothetical protein
LTHLGRRCIYCCADGEPHVTMPYTTRGVLATHTVLITVLESLDDPEQRRTALKLVREVYDLSGGTVLVEDAVVRGAQAKILGEPVSTPGFKPVKNPHDRRAFEVLATAWLVWASGGDPLPFVANVPKPLEYGGALHLMALEPWGRAIAALSAGDTEEALRQYKRSIEFGAQYDIETSDVIQWTYAASFFHRGT